MPRDRVQFHVIGSAATPDWALEQAEEYRAQGRPEAALRRIKREIQRRYEDPDPRVVQLQIELLRELGRASEADAFREFTERYAAGADTYFVDTEPSWEYCEDHQYGEELVRSLGSWGYLPKQGDFEIGILAAAFEVDSKGEIQNIRVLRAKHPGSAWLIIETVGNTRISPTRLREFNRDGPDKFPIPLCFWRDYGDVENRRPDDGRLRVLR